MLRSFWRNAVLLGKATATAFYSPKCFLRLFQTLPQRLEGNRFATGFIDHTKFASSFAETQHNPLWNFFQSHREGPGIWKWEHYFNIYHRHFKKFVGCSMRVVEIGVYSGGSLSMWRKYFGDKCEVFGVDIEPACKAYENDFTRIFVGDQQDRLFWKRFRDEVGPVDIIIDDGGHTPLQQQITLEEMLPYLNPGGVYLCEDILGRFNGFSAFAASLVEELNCADLHPGHVSRTKATVLQNSVHSIHFYPYVLVIEKNSIRPEVFSAPKHGSAWQPFFKNTIFPSKPDCRR